MRTRKVLILGTVIVGLAGGIMVACSDAPSGVHVVAEKTSQHATAPLSISKQTVRSASLVTAAEFHRRNPMDWVGVAHNGGIDLIRAEIRGHRLPWKGMCETVSQLYTRDAFLPANHRISKSEALTAAHNGAALTSFCKGKVPSNATAFPSGDAAVSGSLAVAPNRTDVTVESLAGDIAAAIAGASSVDGYSSTASAIAAQSDTMSTDAQAAVYGEASVALSSLEYWSAGNLTDVTAEVYNEYPCVQAQDCAASSLVRLPMVPYRDWNDVLVMAGADAAAGLTVVAASWWIGPITWGVAGVTAGCTSFFTAVGIIYERLK